MACHRDPITGGIPNQQIGQVTGLTPQGQTQLLVEITVEQLALPVNADQLATHHRLQIRLTMAGPQQLLVALQLTLGPQHRRKALNRQVGEGIEGVKHHPEIGCQHPPVGRLELRLRRRQYGALGVEHQMQLQARAPVAIAQAIELLEGCNAALKHPVAPLPIDVAWGIAGQGRHHGDALGRQEIGQTLLAWLRQDREVAAINHRHTHRPGLSHQLAEVGMELGGSPGEIQAADSPGLQHLGH